MAGPVLLYDGDCGFCTSSARFIERHIPTTAALVAYQFADLEALGTAAGRASGEVLWVEGERIDGGAQAIARLLLDAGGAWRPLGLLIRLPLIRWIAAGIYHLVTVNRHRLPGGTPACALPPPDRPGAEPGAGPPRTRPGPRVS